MKIFYLLLALGLAWAEQKSLPEKVSLPQKLQSNLLAKVLKGKNSTRVIQGEEGSLSHAPYTVSIGVTGHLCSGVIIGSNLDWVLTTAGCVAGLPVKLIRIRYSSEHPNFGGKIGSASYVVVHPNFSRTSMQNDIALIRTTTSLYYSGYRARLPAQNEYLSPGFSLYFNGWGVQTEESGLNSPFLRRFQVPILDSYLCDQNYRSTVGLSIDYSSHLCAGDLYNGGKGFCTGDIGGPLYYWNSDTIYGLASFSVGCGRPGYPGIFTRVANYRNWIDTYVYGGSGQTTPSWSYSTTPGWTYSTPPNWDWTTGFNRTN